VRRQEILARRSGYGYCKHEVREGVCAKTKKVSDNVDALVEKEDRGPQAGEKK